MEHIIFHSIMDHLNTHNIINVSQHGFRPGFLCNLQLMLHVDNINFKSTILCQFLLLDFSKHLIQLHTINCYVNSPIMVYNLIPINRFTTWLTSRTQRISVEEYKSKHFPWASYASTVHMRPDFEKSVSMSHVKFTIHCVTIETVWHLSDYFSEYVVIRGTD